MKKTKWLVDLNRRLTKDFGPKCKDFCWGCAVCSAWMAYGILDNMYWATEKEHISKKIGKKSKSKLS